MLIDRLQETSLFDHPVTGFRVIETHISWVLLTGPFAYKIKKPVNLGFLDFSTLEARRRFCEEELRINRRLAPSLYLGMIPITGTPESPRWNGPGPAFEYAVKMTQFSQEDLLDRRLAAGSLQPSEIDALADLVADFHARLPPAPPDSRFGEPERICKATEECLETLSSLSAAAPVAEWSGRELTRLKTVFRERKEHGFVREGHGDLHLANIVLLDGKPVPFDALEFSEDLRWIDVMNEIAFTVMDLEERGAASFARRFLNRYLEKTGDYEGLRVFRYYLVYRALVRAKVAGIRERQGGKDAGRERDAYLGLAARLSRPPAPRLWITFGLSGSGKTHGTGRFLETNGAIRLRSDVERKRLTGSDYSREATGRVYGRLGELARLLLTEGYPVIVDATFLARSLRREFRELAGGLGVPFGILPFEAPADVLRERLRRRKAEGGDASEADAAVLEDQIRKVEPLSEEEISECSKALTL